MLKKPSKPSMHEPKKARYKSQVNNFSSDHLGHIEFLIYLSELEDLGLLETQSMYYENPLDNLAGSIFEITGHIDGSFVFEYR